MSEHREYRIYDDCGHDHREGDPGTEDIWDVGICCKDGYMYSLCEKCHTRDGEQHEDSPEKQAWPCEVQQGLDKIKELEEALGKAAQAAAREVRELQCGETVEQAVFHAVKAVTRAVLAGKETK